MPIDIEGWIEVKKTDSENWVGVENISSQLIFAGADSNYLFGITKISKVSPVASNRGLPNDLSEEAKSNLEEWKAFEKEESNFSFDELFDFSFLTYSEVAEQKLASKINGCCGWERVFEKMETFANGLAARDNVRVVVWAMW